MTEREAIKLIKSNRPTSRYIIVNYLKLNEALKMAINALENQIPKKPIFDFNSSDTLSRFHCACGNIIWVHHDKGTMNNNDAPNYCSNCSIKLDWNE